MAVEWLHDHFTEHQALGHLRARRRGRVVTVEPGPAGDALPHVRFWRDTVHLGYLEMPARHPKWVGLGTIRRSATVRGLTGKPRRAVDACCGYLLNHREELRYHEFLRDGLPIATGVIEGACRSLVRDRMDITGARWGLPGAEAVLKLRSLRASGDFDEYWHFHQRCELERNHLQNYAEEELIGLREVA